MKQKWLDFFRKKDTCIQKNNIAPTPKVSVILPVYNVDPFIDRCIDSLAKQTLKELEFIFVDDCSEDGSMEKVEAFAEKDSRVRILRNSENLGSGVSRNHGIDMASGEYLNFMDPDDYITDDYYERLYRAATKEGVHDIAKGVRNKVDVYGEIKEGPSNLNNVIRECLEKKHPLYLKFTYEHTTAIFKRSLFEDPGVRYGTSGIAHDVMFLFTICNNTDNIVFDEEAVYYYVQRKGSASNNHLYEGYLYGIFSLRETVDWILDRREPNRYDCEYLATKLIVRHKAYYDAMSREVHLKEHYNDFLSELLDIIDYSGVPEMIIAQNMELKKLYEMNRKNSDEV